MVWKKEVFGQLKVKIVEAEQSVLVIQTAFENSPSDSPLGAKLRKICSSQLVKC